MKSGNMDIYSISLTDKNQIYSANWKVLSVDEKQRAARIRSARQKHRYVISHGKLRFILAEHTGQRPEKIGFVTGKSGKPYLNPSENPGNVQFSLSHSCNVAVIAVCHGYDVGVDVEYYETSRSFMELAGRYFFSGETVFLASLNENDRRRAFYRIWTLKESVLKATGEGIAGLQTVETQPVKARDGQISVSLKQVEFTDEHERNVRCCHFESAAGYVACYAVCRI